MVVIISFFLHKAFLQDFQAIGRNIKMLFLWFIMASLHPVNILRTKISQFRRSYALTLTPIGLTCPLRHVLLKRNTWPISAVRYVICRLSFLHCSSNFSRIVLLTLFFFYNFSVQVIHINVSDHRGANYSGGVRQYIQAHLKKNSDYRITGVRSNSYISDMKKSKFCLAPEGSFATNIPHPSYFYPYVSPSNQVFVLIFKSGWHPWSPRPYYSVLLGCIPVIISEVQELAFEEFIDWDSFAVWVRPADISKLDNILRSFSDQEIERRMQAMKKVWRTMWYARDGLANEAILRSLYLRKYDSPPRRNFSVFQ